MQAGRRQHDRQTWPLNLGSGEGPCGNFTEVSQDASLPWRGRVHAVGRIAQYAQKVQVAKLVTFLIAYGGVRMFAVIDGSTHGAFACNTSMDLSYPFRRRS